MRVLAAIGLMLVATPAAAAMQLASHDLKPGVPMPLMHVYTRCGGQNVSPDLAWSGQPKAAKSLVLTVIDEDVKPAWWSHWLVVDLPPSTAGLAQGLARPPAGAKAAANNFGDAAYDGPCPPHGTGVHHYRITIWAMPGAVTVIAPDARADQVSAMLARTALDHASLTVTAER